LDLQHTIEAVRLCTSGKRLGDYEIKDIMEYKKTTDKKKEKDEARKELEGD
jgi:hypothetical protein